ncbi:MAG: ATP-dependent DNA helicase [Thermovenabulum sp.]|uniref:ATP-dependent DNA helicase n=1 Tax=Thermovenabulum sp. TaxID=3100335 RepID=UPI003C7A2B8D
MILNIKDIYENILPKYGKNKRAAQIEMSNQVEKILNNNKKGIIEAGTGTGKTLAYILPIINKALTTRKPIIISTSTKALQNQLIEKDLPEISNILMLEGLIKEPIKSLAIKGRENYICIKKVFNMMLASTGEIYEKYLSIMEAYKHKKAFEKEQYGREYERLLKQMEPENCKRCEQEKCLYKELRQNITNYNYDILVVNHNYLLACLKESQIDLEKYGGIIIDEAHDIESAAQSIYTKSLTISEIKDIIRVCKQRKINIKTTETVVDALIYQVKNQAKNDMEYNNQTEIYLELSPETKEEIKKAEEELIKEIKYNMALIKNEKLCKKVEKLNDILKNIAGTEEYITWITKTKNKIEINVMPKNISEKLYNILLKEDIPIVMTSATIGIPYKKDINERYDYFLINSGMYKVSTKKYEQPLFFPSPYSIREDQVGIYYEEKIKYKDPESDAEEYIKYLDKKAERIVEIIEKTKGRALILFTSYNTMKYTYNKIKDRIKERGYNAYIQDKNSNKTELIRKFTEDESSCLFATGVFWKGIDVKGPALSAVIIDKLPFPVPTPIIEQKAEEYAEYQGIDRTEALKEIQKIIMSIELNQGAGRLIRSESDRGIIAILDSRAKERYYNEVKNSLPKGKEITTNEITKYTEEDILTKLLNESENNVFKIRI